MPSSGCFWSRITKLAMVREGRAFILLSECMGLICYTTVSMAWGQLSSYCLRGN